MHISIIFYFDAYVFKLVQEVFLYRVDFISFKVLNVLYRPQRHMAKRNINLYPTKFLFTLPAYNSVSI